VEASFKPEFVNRLDDIVEFASLTREQIGSIVDLQVATVLRRVSERDITVQPGMDFGVLGVVCGLFRPGFDANVGGSALQS